MNYRDLEISALSDPESIQMEILKRQEELLGDVEIMEPNNTFSFLCEMFSYFSSSIIKKMDRDVESTYISRTKTAKELFRHMSDFDYVNLFSSPSNTELRFTFLKSDLVNKSEDFNENYKKILIPNDTKITINDIEFGIYYPIQIRISKANESILITYDSSVDSPLHTLNTNTIPFYEQERNGISFVTFDIPIYQFRKTVYEYDVVAASGFNEKISLEDKFYAARIYVNSKESPDTFKEIHQTLSEDIYDPNYATAKLYYLNDRDELNVLFPQIYLDSGEIFNKAKIEVYETLGEIDRDITNISDDAIEVSFDPYTKNEKYSSILTAIQVIATPIQKRITGGANGFSFSELRERVASGSLYDSAPITPQALTNFFKDRGFILKNHTDNLTNRTYFAHRVIYDSLKNVVPAGDIEFSLFEKDIDSFRTVSKNLDGSITVLPSTLFLYKRNNNSCSIVSNEKCDAISSMSKAELCKEFNEKDYMKCPFFMRLSFNERYPTAKTFNLSNPEVKAIVFKSENEYTVEQITCERYEVNYSLENGYTFDFYMSTSKDIEKFDPEESFKIYGSFKTRYGQIYGRELDYIDTIQGYLHYRLNLETKFSIDDKNNISILNLFDDNSQKINDSFIALDTKIELTSFIEKSKASVKRSDSKMVSGINESILRTHLPLIKQDIHVKFGECLSDVLNNMIDFELSKKHPDTYKENIYQKYNADVYERDKDGNLIYEIKDGHVEFNVLHRAGDFVLDKEKNKLILHRKGDIILDGYGNATIIKEREIIYHVKTLMIDANYFVSEEKVHKEFSKNFAKYVNGFLNSIRDASKSMLELREVFFRPVKSIGNAKYAQGDGWTVTLPLQLSMSFRFHVPDFVLKNSDLLDSIKETTIEVIDSEIAKKDISMSEISAILKEQLSDYIYHIDVLGINGNREMQTISLVEKENRPSLEQELYVSPSGIGLRKNVDIEFVQKNS